MKVDFWFIEHSSLVTPVTSGAASHNRLLGAMSMTEAQYQSLPEAAREVSWLRLMRS